MSSQLLKGPIILLKCWRCEVEVEIFCLGCCNKCYSYLRYWAWKRERVKDVYWKDVEKSRKKLRDRYWKNHDKYRKAANARNTITRRYRLCKRLKKYGDFDMTLEQYTTEYKVETCGFCRLPFANTNGLRKVLEHDYMVFWHNSCNLFKGSRNKTEFEAFISTIDGQKDSQLNITELLEVLKIAKSNNGKIGKDRTILDEEGMVTIEYMSNNNQRVEMKVSVDGFEIDEIMTSTELN